MDKRTITPECLYKQVKTMREDAWTFDRGESMCVKEDRNSLRMYLINHNTGEAWKVKDESGKLLMWSSDDVDLASLQGAKGIDNARIMWAPYGFSIGGFRGGRALVSWTLQPEGGYYADEDGFGMTEDEEVKVYGVIDTQCRVCYPFSLKDWREVQRLGMDSGVDNRENKD